MEAPGFRQPTTTVSYFHYGRRRAVKYVRIAATDQFRFLELWQGRLSAVFREPDRCSDEHARDRGRHVLALVDACGQVWPVVERNWVLARLWHGGGRVLAFAAVALAAAALLLSLL